MSTIKTFANSEILLSLTPGGLGRLTAVLDGSSAENPYSAGTPQHEAWQDGFQDALALQRVDWLARNAYAEPHLNS